MAIIVILAIIAAITIPKITKITEKSRKDSASLSANGYIEAVEKYVMIQSQNDDEFEMDGEFIVTDGVSNDVQSPGDYLYLLSTREINMAASDDNRKDTSLYTRTLDYYSSNSASINKYSTASKTSTVSWWLRSAYSNGSYPLYAYSAFYYINKSSSNIDYIGASASEALIPAFRVLD